MDVTSAAADDDDGRGPGGSKRKRNGEGGGTSYLHLAVKEREKKKAREWKGGSTDVLILIFARLNPLSLACCSVVCRTWKQVVDGSPSLWKKVYAEQHTGSLNSRFVKLNKPKEEAGTEESDWKALAIDELQRANLVQGTLSVHVWKAHSTRHVVGHFYHLLYLIHSDPFHCTSHLFLHSLEMGFVSFLTVWLRFKG
jgi:hypothetical protein